MNVEIAAGRNFEVSVPVLVAGAGACGLTAALAASDAGAEVLVLERDAFPVGSTGMSYGAICAAGTSLQRDAGIEDSADWLLDDILAITQGQTDPQLARIIAAGSAPAIEWLVERHDLQLSVETTWTGMGHRRPRLHAPADRSGRTLMSMLQAAVANAGVTVATGARVTTVFADTSRRVIGIATTRPDGKVEEIGCDAFVIATCGFGANRAMVARYIPRIREARYFGHEGNEGDGILWGQALGGAVADMGAYQALGSLADPQAIVIPHTLLIGGGIQVNARGERFENELENISGQALTILDQPGGICWIIYDARLHEAALQRFAEYRDATSVNAMKTAPTVAALASACGLPAEALERTLATVGDYRAGRQRDRFGRDFAASELLVAPYFAIRVTGALFHTQGGLVVDAEARVQASSNTGLPNVFAGGGAARSVSGPAEWGYLPGMGLCTAVTLGRIAGESAARQVQR